MNNEFLYHKLLFINENLKRRNANEKNISRGQGRILAILKYKEGISTRELSEILNIKVPSVNETLNKLIKNGYIRKETSPEDKRVLLIYLTDKGKEYKFQKSKDIDIFDCLDENQKESFDECLNLISKELHERMKAENPEKYDEMLECRKEVLKKYFDCDITQSEWYQLLEKN
ncbi:MAG: MarR family transcriptional regulator [Methanobrevibacter sp.]|uniref:MarR family winged helix-turn-helix transcriptional regulator n=1 Tax=Methanobrevibacter sp. TaxID=66852 RepID=UPI0025F1ED06|nr:MarR family transcriptional regulator [Methanobrevibacter sp.]MBQ6099371.1 MarR family transcriptional regulator [Methanobrevibacter sp.]